MEHPTDGPDTSQDDTSRDDSAPAKGPARLKSPQSLGRLRDRIRHAAQELERLRRENRALRDKIAELETRPPVDVDSALLSLDEDPAVLRAKIEGFIEAIDAYLAKEND